MNTIPQRLRPRLSEGISKAERVSRFSRRTPKAISRRTYRTSSAIRRKDNFRKPVFAYRRGQRGRIRTTNPLTPDSCSLNWVRHNPRSQKRDSPRTSCRAQPYNSVRSSITQPGARNNQLDGSQSSNSQLTGTTRPN